MPRATREAMLRGIDDNQIIVGAYVDNATGGICPMLAAHRNGGRTSFANFARAWDAYTDARGKPRPATRRELRTLRSALEYNLSGDEQTDRPLAEQVRDVKAARRRLSEAEAAESSTSSVEELLAGVLLEKRLRTAASEPLPGPQKNDLRDHALAGRRK